MNELKNKRSSCDDAASSRQEVTADDGLEDTRLSSRLRTNNDNLRQVDRVTANGSEGLLELVDHLDEVDVHSGGMCRCFVCVCILVVINTSWCESGAYRSKLC